ncbi:ABC transporter permease [Streptomyces sp. NPDC017056]|uniref:ABC transporter permease n=1 Tax=Streptomyces sp. NPDC017056 TaxID=3364973 RepID=UPI0037BC9914
MSPRMLGGLALADFRDRVRRPAYAVTLLAAVGLGYLAVPQPGSHWVILQVGDFRGTYNSAYVGVATALAAALWLPLAGFYVVRNALARDERSGVGRLLAATPLRTTGYFAGKLLSNVLVLASMLGVLAVTALVMQLARGESYTVDPLALLMPFVLVALPLMIVTAAAALLFESIPVLRGGVGNVVWFFVWMVLVLGGQRPHAPLGGIGIHGAVATMRDDLIAQHGSISGEFSLGFTYLEQPLRTFVWHGFTPEREFVLSRVAVVLAAAALALLPALWFGRFDPARGGARGAKAGRVAQPVPGHPAPGPALPDAPTPAPAPTTPLPPPTLTTTPSTTGTGYHRLLHGELRILLQGVAWWWWTGAALISLVGFCVPTSGIGRVVLPLAWIWPVLIWSRLGTQRHENGVQALLGSYPAARRRALAEWTAGLVLTAAVGCVPLLRLAMAGEWQGVASWVGGALFIPSLALALGSLSRTHRLFQALYLPLWYSVFNGLSFLDYMGATRPEGQPAALSPVLVTALAALLLAGVLAVAGPLRRAPAVS